jgi:hypothetical protein
MDGFNRILVNDNDVPTLGVVVPTEAGDAQVIAFPLVLPMGWMQPPQLFTAATGTMADLANQDLQALAPAGPHRLYIVSEDLAAMSEFAPSSPLDLPTLPLPSKFPHEADLGLLWSHGTSTWMTLSAWSKAPGSTGAMSSVFSCTHWTTYSGPWIWIKKMRRGDATWVMMKIILGWILDTVWLAVELSTHMLERLFKLLDSFSPHQCRISTKKWQQLVGELHSMVLAIPRGRGIFSVLQQVLKVRTENETLLHVSAEVHTILEDFCLLVTDLKERLTRIAELIPSSLPTTIGVQDAAGPGMGGVKFVPLSDGSILQMLSRSPFPPEV